MPLPERIEYERLLGESETHFAKMLPLLRREEREPDNLRLRAQVEAAQQEFSERHQLVMAAKRAMYRAEENARQQAIEASRKVRGVRA